jgi:hypothetical protein
MEEIGTKKFGLKELSGKAVYLWSLPESVRLE